MIEVLKNNGGWGGVWKQGRTRRVYAVKVNGELLRTSAGAIRTFTTRESAEKAGGK